MAFKQFRKLYHRLVAGEGSIPSPSAKYRQLMEWHTCQFQKLDSPSSSLGLPTNIEIRPQGESMKKQSQLGMNPSTASNRLVKDTLWRLVVQTGQDICYRCEELMTRETFSIEHKESWLDSSDPLGLYFSQENISFSHKSCNYSDSASKPRKYFTEEERLQGRRDKENARRAVRRNP